jgi:hypothetical protein
MGNAFDRAQAAYDDQLPAEYYETEPEFNVDEEVMLDDGTEGTILRIFHVQDEGYDVPMIELDTGAESGETTTAKYADIFKGP